MRKTSLMLTALALAACNQQGVTENGATAATKETKTAAASLSLSRLDCGKIAVKDFGTSFNDTPGLYPKGPRTLSDSCYLIRHGGETMLWDTGFPAMLIGHPNTEPGQTATLDTSLVDQLKTGGVTPDQVSVIGISHYHADHAGQAQAFPNARLLIGQADLDALKAPSKDPFFQMSQKNLARWLTGDGTVEGVSGDKDVFGDGTVVMLDLPGHTPGHHALLVKLKSGPVMLSGDLYHADIARAKRGVPPFNTDRAATLRSMDVFEAKARQFGAKVVIGHEANDIGKVPAFPAAAQ